MSYDEFDENENAFNDIELTNADMENKINKLHRWKVELPDDILAMRGKIEALVAPKPGEKQTNLPIGRFDLFQLVTPKTFLACVGRKPEWSPPRIRLGNTWCGVLMRPELVDDLRQCSNINGQNLANEEVTYCVHIIEYMEMQMQMGRFEPVLRCGSDLLRRFPNIALVYWKTALALLADGLPKFYAKKKSQGTQNAPEQNTAKEKDEEFDETQVSDEGFFIQEASRFFQCAVIIEPNNLHLMGLIDLVVRICVGIPVGRNHRYRDSSTYPRSLGDAVAIEILERSITKYREEVKEEGIFEFRDKTQGAVTLEDFVAESVLKPNHEPRMNLGSDRRRKKENFATI